MRQKLQSTLTLPQSPSYSSQRTTQTSSFFPIKTMRSTLPPKTASDLSDIRQRFRTIIEEKTVPSINSDVRPETTDYLNSFFGSREGGKAENLNRILKRSSLKKLTFNESRKKESQTHNFMNLTKAKEFQIHNNEEMGQKSEEMDRIERSNKKANTLLAFSGKNNKNPLIIHTKHESIPQIDITNPIFTPKNTNNEFVKYDSNTERMPERQNKKMYQTQSHFLKKIVKIDKPKFELKMDFINKKDLHANYKNFMFSQAVLGYIKGQCKSAENSINIYKFIEISKDNYTYILQLFPLIRTAINSVKNRSDIDKAFHEIEIKCQQSHNMALTIRSLLLHAKIILMLQDVYKAIIIYKNCKKLAVNFQLFHYLISCYKGLGRCFQYLKQYSLALNYFAKMLQCSWKLNDKDHEILSYDLIGMQFFYLGDLEKSKYYHQRMVDGEIEPENSNVRKLAVTRFLHKKPKNSVKEINRMSENPLSQFTDNLLDSSDEGFQLPNPTTRRNVSEPDLKKHFLKGTQPKKTKSKFLLPGKNLMAMMEKKRKERMIGSVRTTEEFKRLLSKNISEGRLNKKGGNVYCGEKQEKIMLSHLSPNRELLTYQMFKPVGVRNINFYNINDFVYENEDFAYTVKIKEKLKKYAERLLLTNNKLKAIFSKNSAS